MSLGERLHVHSDEQDEGEWASRYEDTAEALDAVAAVAVAITSNGEREWDATAGALTSAAAHDQAEGVLTSATTQENRDGAMELAVLGDTCPICLQGLDDSVMIQSCYHVYCFECLNTWVQSLALHGIDPPTCPLCKAQFETIFTNVASEHEYEVFRFHGKQRRDSHAITRQREQSAQRQQRLQRRSLVYRRRMRLAKINGTPVPLQDTTASTSDAQVQYPKIVKVRGEYDAWLQRELEACIGSDIDLTVLVSLIQCCLDKIHRSDVARGYKELEVALQPFLYEDAAIFVREFAFFLGSRLNLDAYDSVLEYCCSNSDECATALCTAVHSE